MTPPSRAATAGAVAWILLVAWLTLSPSSLELTPSGFCILCGERGLSDAILNVFLFLPLGLGAGRLNVSPLVILALGAGLSLAIETAQLVIPGRDASIGDVLFNVTGALLGAAIAPRLRTLLRPDDAVAGMLSLVWGLAIAVGAALLAWLLEPGVPSGPLEIEAIPPAPEGGFFQGSLLAIRVDGEPVPDGARIDWGAGPGRIEVRYTAVEPRFSFRPVLALASSAGAARPVMLGPKEDDVILRLSRAASGFKLTPPDLALQDAFDASRAGDTLTALAWREGDSFCLGLDERLECGLGYTAGSGWTLLLPSGWWNGARDRWLDAIWLAIWGLPLGLWWRPGGRSRGAILLALGSVLAIPTFSGLMAAPVATGGGLAAGVLAGRGAGRLIDLQAGSRRDDRAGSSGISP